MSTAGDDVRADCLYQYVAAIAGATFFARPGSAYITGAALNVDGGFAA
jgi:hypothetical protein